MEGTEGVEGGALGRFHGDQQRRACADSEDTNTIRPMSCAPAGQDLSAQFGGGDGIHRVELARSSANRSANAPVGSGPVLLTKMSTGAIYSDPVDELVGVGDLRGQERRAALVDDTE